MPEKDVVAINAFSICWKYKLHYAFPPFSVIGRVIQKLCENSSGPKGGEAEGHVQRCQPLKALNSMNIELNELFVCLFGA